MAKDRIQEWWAIRQAMALTDLIRYSAASRLSARFEERFSAVIDARRVVTVTSGTTALMTAIAGAGIGRGDKVLVPVYTWMATIAAPLMARAVPILVDIDATARNHTPVSRISLSEQWPTIPARQKGYRLVKPERRPARTTPRPSAQPFGAASLT